MGEKKLASYLSNLQPNLSFSHKACYLSGGNGGDGGSLRTISTVLQPYSSNNSM